MTDLERDVFKLEAHLEIQNLMGAYSFLLDGGKVNEIIDLFSRKQVDVRADIGNGIYQGLDGLVKLYPGQHEDENSAGFYPGYRKRGTVSKHSQNTPVIVIGDDLRTAKGTWVSLGFASFPRSGKNELHWHMFRYGADFIFEDGSWKIWHLRVYSGMIGGRDPFSPKEMPKMPPMEMSKEMIEAFSSRMNKFPADLPEPAPDPVKAKDGMDFLPDIPEPYQVFDMSKAH